jgi:WD40 repeat protein
MSATWRCPACGAVAEFADDSGTLNCPACTCQVRLVRPPRNATLRTTDQHRVPLPRPDTTADLRDASSAVAGDTGAFVPGATTEPERVICAVAVPGYEILGVLGRGGMGVVYQARHLALKRVVALKMILAGAYAGPHELARFHSEAEAVARLQHPNIVQVFEVGESEGHPFCALEFVEGGTLAARISGQPLPATEAARLVEVLARAVQLAHSRNVVHRDLKPANVLLASDGTPKITDFGLARQMDSNSHQTQAGAIMGTPSYMAPEQASGRAHEAGPAADIYALGAILYACLTGRPPFQGQNLLETLDQVRHHEPVPPARLQHRVPLDLETICLKCLRKEPEKRYASAQELADELSRFLRGEPILARPVGRLERTWRWCRRNPSLALLSAGLVVVLLVGLATSIFFALVASGEAAEARFARGQAEERAQAATAAGLLADRNAERARVNERLAYDRAYTSDLRLFQQAWNNNQFDFAREVLDRQRPERTDGLERRGFEWDYWHRQSTFRVRTFDGLPGPIYCLAYSPDGKTVVSGGRGDFVKQTWIVKIWDARTAQEVHTLQGDGRWVTAVTFSPDSKVLAASTSDEKVARVWDVETGEVLLTLEGHAQFITALAYSPDGRHLATGSGDGTVRLWDALTGQERLVLQDNQPSVDCVCFSPDGTRVAAGGSGDNALRVWDVATSRRLLTLSGHRGLVRTAAFSPDGKWLASGGFDGRVLIWDALRGNARPALEIGTGNVRGVAFSPDSRWLASTSEQDGVKLWDVETGQPLVSLKGQKGIATGVSFSPDGQRLAAAYSEGKVVFWDVTAAARAAFPTPGPVQVLACSADGRHLIGGMRDGPARTWDARTGAVLREFGSPGLRVLAVHPEGHQVVAQGVGLVLEVWDPRDGRRLHREEAHDHGLQAAAYSPDGGYFATVGRNGAIRIWSATDFKPRTFADKGQAFGIAYDGQGNYLALRDGQGVKVLAVATGRLVTALADPTNFFGPVVYSPDGQYLAAGNQMGVVTIWEVKSGRVRHRLTGHTDIVTGLAYSPDGRRLASCSHDRSVKVWEVGAGEELLTLSGTGAFHCVGFSPRGEYLFAGADGGVRIWEGAR